MTDARLTYTVEEAARLLGVGRASAYAAARSGDLPAIRVGRRLLVPRLALERLLYPGNDSRPADTGRDVRATAGEVGGDDPTG